MEQGERTGKEMSMVGDELGSLERYLWKDDQAAEVGS